MSYKVIAWAKVKTRTPGEQSPPALVRHLFSQPQPHACLISKRSGRLPVARALTEASQKAYQKRPAFRTKLENIATNNLQIYI